MHFHCNRTITGVCTQVHVCWLDLCYTYLAYCTFVFSSRGSCRQRNVSRFLSAQIFCLSWQAIPSPRPTDFKAFFHACLSAASLSVPWLLSLSRLLKKWKWSCWILKWCPHSVLSLMLISCIGRFWFVILRRTCLCVCMWYAHWLIFPCVHVQIVQQCISIGVAALKYCPVLQLLARWSILYYILALQDP